MTAHLAALGWNTRHPVGTPVRYWPGTRHPDLARTSRTSSRAWVLASGAAVVRVEGYAGGIALTHVDALTDVPEDPDPLAALITDLDAALSNTPRRCPAPRCQWDTRGTAAGAGPTACVPGRPYLEGCLLREDPDPDQDDADTLERVRAIIDRHRPAATPTR